MYRSPTFWDYTEAVLTLLFCLSVAVLLAYLVVPG